jgi:hypothetical protein
MPDSTPNPPPAITTADDPAAIEAAAEDPALAIPVVRIQEPPMLDVHAPHESIHTWRDFFIHIATIVVGLCIAVGLEQTVEYFHHLHQVHQMEASLRQEDLANRFIIQSNLQTIDLSIAKADAGIVMLQALKPGDSASPLPQHHSPGIFPPGNTAWLTMSDSGLLAITPRRIVDNYRKVYFIEDATVTQLRTMYADSDRLSAQMSLYTSAATLTPADRSSLLLSYANYRESLKVLRIDLVLLDMATDMAYRDEPITVQKAMAGEKSMIDK